MAQRDFADSTTWSSPSQHANCFKTTSSHSIPLEASSKAWVGCFFGHLGSAVGDQSILSEMKIQMASFFPANLQTLALRLQVLKVDGKWDMAQSPALNVSPKPHLPRKCHIPGGSLGDRASAAHKLRTSQPESHSMGSDSGCPVLSSSRAVAL